MMGSRLTRFAVAFVAAAAVAGGAYAFTAANTVPNSNAGSGAGTVSGYTVTNVHYALNATTPVNIDSLTFTVNPVIPNTGTGKVIVQAPSRAAGRARTPARRTRPATPSPVRRRRRS